MTNYTENNSENTQDALKTEYLPEKRASGRFRCITLVGHIEGHYIMNETQKTTKYENILPELVEINTDKSISGVLILLNTVGGDVEAGLAIAEMIASMDKPTVSLVLGGGHSIGVPLAVSARKSFIVPSATMTVHPVRISGTVVGAPQTFYYFNRMQDRILDFVANHSKISAERLRELMMKTDEIATDVGSIIDGRQAVEEGIIDEIGGLSDALRTLIKMSENH
ncbi:MAG: ATP-dependent Clp protease proteolytic subunit [Clostridia bacterium]|nr:ATP-dependent Clp protease proteolytic subunit [Clostridia bacterium]